MGTVAPDQLRNLGERVARLLAVAAEHERKAAEARQKADELAKRFTAGVEQHVHGAHPSRRPRRSVGETDPGPVTLGVSEVLRTWAKEVARPFRFPEAAKIMRATNPVVTNGPFYHLVRRGEIKKLSRGLFVHPDLYDQYHQADDPVAEEVSNPITH